MMPRRSSVFVCSVIAHVILIGVLLIASAVAPGLLPTPVSSLVYAIAAPRPVRLVDIPLPKREPRSTSQSNTPASSQPAFVDAAPVDAPDRLPDNGAGDPSPTATGDPGGLAIESSSSGVVDGGGLPVAEPPPPAPAERTPVRLHQGIQAPRKVYDVPPMYPEIARVSRTEGVVILEVVVDEAGAVKSTRVLKSIPLLDRAAVDAVSRWRFTPARLNGEAIPVVMTVTVNFTLQR